MCSIQAAIGNIKSDIFIPIVIMSDRWVRDGAGIWILPEDPEESIFYETGYAFNFDYIFNKNFYPNSLIRNSFDLLQKNKEKLALIDDAHCVLSFGRTSTIGNVVQPIVCEEIVGMHNGTVPNYQALTGYKDKRNDSEALINYINDYPNDLDALFRGIEGKASFIYFKDEKLYVFCKTNAAKEMDRPLFYMRAAGACYIAKDPDILRYAARMQFIDSVVYSFMGDTLYEVTATDVKKLFTVKKQKVKFNKLASNDIITYQEENFLLEDEKGYYYIDEKRNAIRLVDVLNERKKSNNTNSKSIYIDAKGKIFFTKEKEDLVELFLRDGKICSELI